MKRPFTRLTLSGRLLEVTQQSTPPLASRGPSGGRKRFGLIDPMRQETNKKKCINRARTEIKRLLECNFTEEYAFLTLTFRPSKQHDFTDLNTCNKLFYDFKKRLKYYLKKNQLPLFNYIGVTEFHDSGLVHFHFVCNLIDIPLKDLEILWDYGWINRQVVDSNPMDNTKLSYYMNKGIMDPRLSGRKKYLRSHGLKKPLRIMIDNWEEFCDHIGLFNTKELDSGSYESNLYGEIKYHNYYVGKPKELMEYVQEL